MLKSLAMLGVGWFIYTKTGRKMAKNIAINSIPYLEKELGIKIIEPIKELTKEPKEVKDES